MAAALELGSSDGRPGRADGRAAHLARLLGLFAAITAAFLVYSLVQERLMTVPFEGEKFRHSLFIILVNRLVTVAVAAAALGLAGHSLQPAAPLGLFAVPAVANVLGSASQYEALKYVSFPLQALAKCAKTVPVMAWGLLLGGRTYDAADYASALTITSGCALFVLTGSIAAPQLTHGGAAGAGAHGTAASGGEPGNGAGQWMVYGLLLLGAFLLFDGLTSTTQDKLFSQYDMHSCNQLLWVSVWSAAISLALLVAGDQLRPALVFVGRHPSALGFIFLLAGVSTTVQLFMFYTIQQFGALDFALIMTLRQFLSIVLSCLVFAHDLSPSQWLGTALVIGGLVARGRYRRSVDRAPAVAKAPALQGGASRAAPVLLPLVTVPVTSALDAREATQLLLAPDASATDGGMEGGEAKGLLHPAAPTPVNVLPGRP